MGFNFSFFGNQEHRVFNYKPRYFDPEKEERRRIFGKVDGSADKDDREDASKASDLSGDKDYTPGKYLSGSFRDGNYQRTRLSTTKTHKLIGLVGLVLFFIILYYIVQFYGYILK